MLNAGEFVSAIATEDLGGGNYGASSEFSAVASSHLPLPFIDLDGDNSSSAADPNYVGDFTENGGPVQAADTDATISDADSGNLVSVTVTLSNPLNGAAEFLSANTTGTSITGTYFVGTGVLSLTGSDTIANYEQVLRTVRYNNVSAVPDTTPRTITVIANDGNNDGNVAVSVLSVTAVNNTPAFTGLDETPNFTEGGPATLLDSTTGIGDVELGSLNGGAGNYSGSTLTLARHSAVNSDDVFSFSDDNGITLLAGNLLKNGQSIATFDTTTTAGELLISFTDANSEIPTSADVDNVLSQITYANISAAPPSSVLIDYVFDDGNSGSQGIGGAAQATGSLTVGVTALNDAPVLDNTGVPSMTSITEDDVNNSGDLIADIIARGAGGDPITDADTSAVEGIAIRSVLSPGSGTWQYSTNAGVSWANLGSVNDSSALLLRDNDRLRYVPDPLVGADSSTLSWKAWDQSSGTAGSKVSVASSGGSTAFSSANDAIDVSVTAVNDAPVLDLDGDNSSGATGVDYNTVFTENGGPVSIADNDWILSDIDNTSLAGMSITLFWQQNVETIDFTLPSSNISVLAFATGAPGSITFSFTGLDSVANYQTLLQSLTYENPSENPDTSPRIIRISVNDGSDASLVATTTVTTVAINDAPTASNLSTPEVYTEDTVLDLSDIVVTDVDDTNTQVTLTLSDAAAGTLSVASSGAVSSSFNPATGVWTASGAVSDVNTLLAGVTFTPASNYDRNISIATSVNDGIAPAITGLKTLSATPINDAPVATNLDAPETFVEDLPLDFADIVIADVDSANVTATLTLSNVNAGQLSTATVGATTSVFDPATGVWSATGTIADVNALLVDVIFTPATNFSADFSLLTSVSDGAATVTGTKLMRNVAVNDAPMVSNLTEAETYTEDTALALTPIVVADVDSPNVTVTLTMSDPDVGTLSTGTSGSVIAVFDADSGEWRASGAVDDVNTLLATVVFTPAENESSDFILSVSVSDGIVAPVIGEKRLTGQAVNDAPTAQGEQFELIENGTLILEPAQLLSNDVDVEGDVLSIVLVDAPEFGQLTVDQSGRLVYRPVSGFVGQDFFTYRVSDGELSSEVQTVSLIVQDDGTSGATTIEPEPEPEPEKEEPVQEEESAPEVTPPAVLDEQSSASEFVEEPSYFDSALPEFALNTRAVGQSLLPNIASVEFEKQAQELDDDVSPHRLDSGSGNVDLNLEALELMFADDDLWRDLKTIEEVNEADRILVQTVMGSSAVLSTGVVAWVLRGGSLLASLLTTLPAWRSFDPLPIMTKKDQNGAAKNTEENSVDQMFG